MKLIHIDHPNIPAALRQQFGNKVQEIAAFLLIDPNWLMQVMYAESRLRANAQNIQQGRLIAAGLLQWTKASGAPGAPQSMLQRNHLQQLDWVKEYFKPYRGRMHSYFDVYLVTFFPAAVAKPDNYVFATGKLPASLIARQNPAVNINKDSRITMAEFKQYVWNSTPAGVRGVVFKAQQLVAQAGQEVTETIEHIRENQGSTAIKAAGGIATIIAFFLSFVI